MPPPRFSDLPTALVHHTSIALSKPKWGQSLSETTKISSLALSNDHTPAVVQTISAGNAWAWISMVFTSNALYVLCISAGKSIKNLLRWESAI